MGNPQCKTAPTLVNMVDAQQTDVLNIAVIGGDGIGPEVVTEGLKVLSAVTASSRVKVAITDYDLGARRWLATGETLPDSALAEIRGHDAILLGAVGDPGVPSGVLERGLLLKLRFALDQYVNLRPVRLYPGVLSPLALERVAPHGIDFVVVREGTEGPYVGNGGALRVGSAAAIAGGIGLAASGNINPERTAPSMFEPVHGSAPDIAGQNAARQ